MWFHLRDLLSRQELPALEGISSLVLVTADDDTVESKASLFAQNVDGKVERATYCLGDIATDNIVLRDQRVVTNSSVGSDLAPILTSRSNLLPGLFLEGLRLLAGAIRHNDYHTVSETIQRSRLDRLQGLTNFSTV